MNQRLAGSPRQEGSYKVGINDVRELVALLGEALDVPMEGLTGLLTTVLEIPWVPRALVMETGIPIFRQVVVTVVVAENDTPIRLQIENRTLQS